MRSESKPVSAGQITLLLAALISIMPFAVDAYLPAMAAIALDFGTSVHWLEQSMNSFFIGIAMGQLVGAPFSDRLGRRPPILVGLVIFIVASAGISYTDNTTSLIVWRFVQAFGTGVATVSIGAIVRDLFDEVGTAKLFANIAVVMMIAPLISPLIGAYLLEAFGWPSIFIFLTIYGILISVVMFKLLPESRDLRATPIVKKGYRIVLASTWSNVLVMSLAFSGVCFFLYLSDSSFLFLQFYEQSPKAFAWIFAGGVIMLVMAHRLNSWLLNRYKPRRILYNTIPLQAFTAFLVFVYAHFFAAQNMWLMYFLIMMMACTTQIINSNGLAIYLSLHPNHAGKANAIWGSIRFALGGGFGLLLVNFHTQNPTGFATLVLIAAVISNLLFFLCRTKSDLFSLQQTS